MTVRRSERENKGKSKSASNGRKAISRPEADLTGSVVRGALDAMFADVADVDVETIDSEQPLSAYGIDSLMITHLNQRLGTLFEDLPSTLFFEHLTLRAVADYLLAHRGEDCARWAGSVSETTTVAASRPLVREPVSALAPPFGLKEALRERIAIIGMTGRYPGARDLSEYWTNLASGIDSVSEIPQDRWPLDGFFDPDPDGAIAKGRSYSRWGGFIDGFADFDPLFFNISPREAANMDPQERIFLQAGWEVLEEAGYTREQLATRYGGRVGVFAGITKTGFNLYGSLAMPPFDPHTSFASVANRVSYILNLHGPSMPVDTMCSASLTAIHEACEHIRSGSCDMAIAGGVNLTLHPSNYVRLSALRMLSADGRCKAFSKDGNGYVPGEGCGLVLLKPLSRAVADGDHIYGVILGSSINHGGRTNSYTVPNPDAQRELIRDALASSRISARTISYVEAHGTGTDLGDPIEIAGLAQAFAPDTSDTQFCAIGSVKSNIGHLEAAAGVAGLAKVLLQFQHQQLVPSIHVGELNPKIPFAATPFAVQRELREWKRPVIAIGGIKSEYPRRAAISSFGAGGANAHVIVEEYVEERQLPSPSRRGRTSRALIVLSAKTTASRVEQARRLLAAVSSGRFQDEDLTDIAYTLQIGREAMEARFACMAVSLDDLRSKLDRYARGQQPIPDVYVGEGKRNKDSQGKRGDEFLETPASRLNKSQCRRLLDLWVKGFSFDWTRLYGDGMPRRVSLPTYAFTNQRYWIPAAPAQADDRGPLTVLHPLLHRNTSDLQGPRFTSIFHGNEFFLADHVIRGERILPGVAYLEMVQAGISETVALESIAPAIRLTNHVWSRPLKVNNQPVSTHLVLAPDESGAIEYEIYSTSMEGPAPDGSSPGEIVHGSGRASILARSDGDSMLDLSFVRAQCGESISVDRCYAAFSRLGVEYGSAHRTLEAVFRGADTQGRPMVLAHLASRAASSGWERFCLHPGLVDGALQASLALRIEEIESATDSAALRPMLPFAIEQVDILAPSPEKGWSYLRRAAESEQGDAVQKFDVDLCDDGGRVCLRLRGMSSRVPVESGPGEQHIAMLGAEWQARAPSSESSYSRCGDRHWVLLAGLRAREYRRHIEDRWPGSKVVLFDPAVVGCAARVQAIATQLLEMLQPQLRDHPGLELFIQLVVPLAAEEGLYAAIGGLLATAGLEYPGLGYQVIAVDPGESAEALIAKLEIEGRGTQDREIRYRDDKREVKSWAELSTAAPVAWKRGAAYLITGGGGGLGLILADDASRSTGDMTIVLSGRSPALSEAAEGQLNRMRSRGTRIEYGAADMTDDRAAESLCASIRERWGRLDGVVHAAGVIDDALLVHKNVERFEAVLAPKIVGAVNLDIATRDDDLDFFVMLSSVVGVMGNVGQSDYATANAFLDAFAAYRNTLVASGERRGRSISIDWPAWADGAMRVPTRSGSGAIGGMKPLSSSDGIAAFHRALAAEHSQVVVLSGDVARLRRRLENTHPVVSREVGQQTPGLETEDRVPLEAAQTSLMQLVSSLLKVPIEDIDLDAEFGEFGFDSITLTELAGTLNRTYSLELMPTIFFEHPTIGKFARYLVEINNCSIGKAFVGTEESGKFEHTPNSIQRTPSRLARRHTARSMIAAPASTPAPEPIAIIGMAGRFPGAPDLDVFWKNLRDGADSIQEIPSDRWDWRSIYGDPMQNPNKTTIKWGAFLDGIGDFDPLFFGISPRQAESIDPQQRLLMMCTWQAIEDAGYAPHSLAGSRTAIFVGAASQSDYGTLAAASDRANDEYSVTGTVGSMGPSRVSYFLDLRGPSEPVETACSSSLVAIHRAVLALRADQCEMAIAGGVNTILTPRAHISFSRAGMLCEDGRCKTFSSKANGYVRGEGIGVLVLKKLSDAERAGDHILALIRASAENHGGRGNALTAPNPDGQTMLLKMAYTQAAIDPRTVTYIEAHGTGTALGDPIEINALKHAFAGLYAATGDTRATTPRCGIGSVKTNIGHLELAAGAAGVIKVLLQLRHRTLVKTLHCDELNPYIDLKDSPFYIVRATQPWQAAHDESGAEAPRRAGVSSFGLGGVNAHVVLEEYQGTPARSGGGGPSRALIVLSGKTSDRLAEQSRNMLDAVRAHNYPEADLLRMAYTLQVGRDAMEHRIAFIVDSVSELEEKLSRIVAGEEEIDGVFRGEVKRSQDSIASLSEDEDFRPVISTWISKGEYDKLLALWADGVAFDWGSLYSGAKMTRMSLPAYPFARERCWISDEAGTAPAVYTVAAVARY